MLYTYYDLRGLKTLDLASDGRITSYAYDGFGRLTVENTPVAGVMSYTWDAHGNRTRMTWANDGFFVDYDYDQLDRVTKIRENGASSGVGVLASYAYAPDGKPSSVTYGNGTARTYQYNAGGRTVGVKLDLAGSADDLIIGQVAAEGVPVQFNPAGQIISLTRSNDAYAWTAHALFERDYAVNGLNQYTLAGGTALGYDGRGNLTQSGSNVFGYTRLNELKSAPNGAGGMVELGYDTAGRLGLVTSGGVTTKLLYSGPNLVAEIGAGGTVLRRYVHGPGTDDPLVWYEGAGTSDRRFLQADQLGSVVAISDGTGAKLAINRYDEYGIPQSGNLGRFQYTGQTWWGEVGLYNYKARWYSPTLGRFMQVDPIGYKDNVNLYAYVGNDPVNLNDPTGLHSCDTVNPDGTPGPRMQECIGDPDAPATPIGEATKSQNEIVVTANKLKEKDDVGKKLKNATISLTGEVGLKIDDGEVSAVDLAPMCTKGSIQQFKFPDGFLDGTQDAGGHVHNADQESGLGPHDASMALATGSNIQVDDDGVHGLFKSSSGGAYALTSGGWGDTGSGGTSSIVRDLSKATKGSKGNASSTKPAC